MPKFSQTLQGVIVTDGMNKSRVMELRHYRYHCLYQKRSVGRVRVLIHDEKNASKVGDKVIAVSSRPISGKKSFRLLRILGEGVRT